MRLLRHLLAPVAALALAGAASAAPSPVRLDRGENFTAAHRPLTAIRFVVIHVTEGSFGGTVAWLRDPQAHASANFVVSRTGQVRQLVPLHDIAWQAGNWSVNRQSIGIENVGYTNSPAGFTTAEYVASAKIAASVARRALMPIDRQHIIGHDQVPDPNDPLQGGGIDGHTDPGRYWRWGFFMRLVERFAYPQRWWRAKHVGLSIRSSTLYGGQVVAGSVPWRARVGGPVRRVAFLVDGKVRWIDHVAPFAYAGGKPLDTLALRNGRHVLELRAYGTRSWKRRRFVLRVHNRPLTLAQVAFEPGQQVNGVVPIRAIVTGKAAQILLLLDGRVIAHDTSLPFLFRWNTRRVRDGRHTIELRGRAPNGNVVRSRVTVVVDNAAVTPRIVASSLADGETVAGLQHWLVSTGGAVASVSFSVDGAVRSTATAAPYAWDWDTTEEPPGPHALTLTVIGADGDVVTQTATVTVAAATAPPAVAG